MKTLSLTKSLWMFAIVASLACLALCQNSFASDTQVTCTAPQVFLWYTGVGKTANPQVTIDCTGGSSAGYEYYAFLIKNNTTLASAIPVLVGNAVLLNGTTSSITIYSDLSDLSGSGWGCGNSNCRIIDIVVGY